MPLSQYICVTGLTDPFVNNMAGLVKAEMLPLTTLIGLYLNIFLGGKYYIYNKAWNNSNRDVM